MFIDRSAVLQRQSFVVLCSPVSVNGVLAMLCNWDKIYYNVLTKNTCLSKNLIKKGKKKTHPHKSCSNFSKSRCLFCWQAQRRSSDDQSLVYKTHILLTENRSQQTWGRRHPASEADTSLNAEAESALKPPWRSSAPQISIWKFKDLQEKKNTKSYIINAGAQISLSLCSLLVCVNVMCKNRSIFGGKLAWSQLSLRDLQYAHLSQQWIQHRTWCSQKSSCLSRLTYARGISE